MRYVRVLVIVMLLCGTWGVFEDPGRLGGIGASVIGPSSPELRDLLRQLYDVDPQIRLTAARTLARDLTVMEEDTLRKLKGLLRSDSQSRELRCAIADIFASLARRKRWVASSRTPLAMIAAMQDCFWQVQDPQVRICILNAAAEFNSDAVDAIFQRANNDGDGEVRDAARAAVRRRENRRRSEGL